MANYKNLSKQTEQLIVENRAKNNLPNFFCNDNDVVRRKDNQHDKANVWRTAFAIIAISSNVPSIPSLPPAPWIC